MGGIRQSSSSRLYRGKNLQSWDIAMPETFNNTTQVKRGIWLPKCDGSARADFTQSDVMWPSVRRFSQLCGLSACNWPTGNAYVLSRFRWPGHQTANPCAARRIRPVNCFVHSRRPPPKWLLRLRPFDARGLLGVTHVLPDLPQSLRQLPEREQCFLLLELRTSLIRENKEARLLLCFSHPRE
jgi:hypothetical protein